MLEPKDKDHSRITHIYGSMCSMYYVEQSNIIQNRYIRMEGQYYPESVRHSKSFQESFNGQVQISSLSAWLLLFTSVMFSAFVPCWLLADVKSQPLTRNSWRYFTVSLLMVPFLFYQQRNIKNQSQKLINQLTPEKLKPVFVGSLNYSVWLICLIYACRFTSMNHALCLSYLRFFLISALKITKKQKVHQFQIAGSILCSIGVLLVMSDSLALPQIFGPGVQSYKQVEPWKRFLLGDGLAVIASFVSVYLDQHFVVPQMPRFTYLFLYNLFLTFNLITSGYFFGGSQFNFNTKFGIFGLFTYENFVSVFYVSIMLGFYLMIVNILVQQIFNDVIINVGMCFELILTSIAWHALELQKIPANMTCLGYAFITPGLIFIIGGQGALENKENTMNFQLYRPTQIIRNTSIMESPGALNSFSIDKENQFDSPFKQKSKILDKIPFEMILQQDQTQEKNQRKNIKNE